jgi:hypothetical protein
MPPLATLVHALYREEVARARTMSPTEKLLEGPRLFQRAYGLMAAGIRHQHPNLDEVAVVALLRARLERLRTIERA